MFILFFSFCFRFAIRYALIASPVPGWRFWRYCLLYEISVLFILFAFQLDIFCLNYWDPNKAVLTAYPSFQPLCPDAKAPINATQSYNATGFANLLGVYKFTDEGGTAITVSAVLCKIALIFALIYHRTHLKRSGFWRRDFHDDDGGGSLASSDEDDEFRNFGGKDPTVIPSPSAFDVSYAASTRSAAAVGGGGGKQGGKARAGSASSFVGRWCGKLGECLVPARTRRWIAGVMPPPPQLGSDELYEKLKINRCRNHERAGSDAACPGCRAKSVETLMATGELQEGIIKLLKRDPNFERAKPGKDLYNWTFLVQLLLLLDVLLFYAKFIASKSVGGASKDLESFSTSATTVFTAGTVIAMLLIVVVILVDRVAFLSHSHRLKMLLHYVTLVTVHYFCFFRNPSATERPFSSNGMGVLFYFLWAWYLAVSALQLRRGYSLRASGNVFMNHGDGNFMWKSSLIYQSIPFLFELRAILDWCLTDTSLDLWMWLKVEHCYAKLFLTKCNMTYRRNSKDVLRGTQPQPFLWKFLFGWLIFGAILLLILGPIIIFSGLNPGLRNNPVIETEVHLSFVNNEADGPGTFPFFTATTFRGMHNLTWNEGGKEPGVCDFPGPDGAADPDNTNAQTYLKNQIFGVGRNGQVPDKWENRTQRVTMQRYPDNVWDIPEQGLHGLLNILTEKKPVCADNTMVELEFIFHRNNPPGYATVSTTPENGQALFFAKLNVAQCACLESMVDHMSNPAVPVNTTHCTKDEEDGKYWLVLPGMLSPNDPVHADGTQLPPIVVLPSVSGPSTVKGVGGDVTMDPAMINTNRTDIQIRLESPAKRGQQQDAASAYWEVAMVRDAAEKPGAHCKPWPETGAQSNGLRILAVSEPIPPSYLYTIGGASILGVYVLLITYVGSAVRGFFLDPMHMCPVTEMRQPDDLMELVEGIYLARQEAYEGHRKDEVRLFNILLNLYRSPATLYKITKDKLE